MVLLAEAGNGKTLFARRILKIQQEKYPDTFTFFIHLKTFAKKKECSLGEILLPAEFQGNAPGKVFVFGLSHLGNNFDSNFSIHSGKESYF